jgi:hypothetical protein
VENMSRLAATNRVFLYASGTVLVQDTFTDADSTALVSHSPDIALNSATWLQDGSEDLVITSNEASSSGITGAQQNYSYIDAQNQDLTVNATLTVSNTGNVVGGIMLRYLNPSNYIILRISHLSGIVYNCAVQVFNKGVESLVATLATDTGLIGLPAVVNAVDDGSSINFTVTIDGTDYTYEYVTDNFNTSTKCGIRCDGTDITVDDFSVTKS